MKRTSYVVLHSAAFRPFNPLRSKYYPHHPIDKHPQSVFFP